MAANKQEKRSAPRFQVQVPVKVKVKNGGVYDCLGNTRDMSRNGVFLYAEREMKEGSELEMVLMLPPEITASRQMWVCAYGHVVRVERDPVSGMEGVAAVWDRYTALPEAQ